MSGKTLDVSPISDSLKVESWRKYTQEEVSEYIDMLSSKNGSKKLSEPGGTIRTKKAGTNALVVRKSLSPIDIYCYLKARFGEPNGLQSFLRNDDSDNWIHWDYYLKANDKDVHICGTSREIHFLLTENLSDKEWNTLICNVKADYKRMGSKKGAVQQSLEKWVIFPNKFIEIAKICEELHFNILENMGGYRPFQLVSSKSKSHMKRQEEALKQLGQRANNLYKSCLELSLITPVLAEAFINMTILMLCKKEIRGDERQFKSFIKSQIDTKVFDLFYKCEAFIKPVDGQSDIFKNFRSIMNKRNDSIHANIDPIKEKIEVVYFQGKIPLFEESGDNVGKVFEAMERQYQPETVLKDYEDVHIFLMHIADHIHPRARLGFWRVMEDNQPGYDVNRQILGAILPAHAMVGALQGMRYDDELIL